MQNVTHTTHNPPPSRMKSLQSLLLLSIVAVSLSSCMVYDYPGGYSGGPVAPPVAVSVGTYSVLPSGYAGDAYYYGNRYYYGGRYQTGRYYNSGRYYSNRYYHNGHYYYGGNHRHYGGGGHQSYRPAYRGGYRGGHYHH